MLSVAGGTYQGVFRNPLADPYLLGVAAGAGLGATFAIVDVGAGLSTPAWTPLLAFVGAMGAVALTWLVGGRGLRSNASSLILAGVAVFLFGARLLCCEEASDLLGLVRKKLFKPNKSW